MRAGSSRLIFLALLAVLMLSLQDPACAVDWNSLLRSAGVSKQSSLAGTKIGDGLKEALKVGIDRTIQMTGKKDGYFTNEAIKILMPEKIRPMEGWLRKAGLGPKIDEFVLSMNRSAEAAAPYARDIFVDAIVGMSIEDAEHLLKGGDTAATEFFRKSTSAKLAETYRPVIAKAMSQNAVAAKYQTVVSKYQQMPLAAKFPAPSIEDYTVQKSLDGLFLVLGQQEKEIRRDPAARSTQLLREVFGRS